ncbi:MAG: hypothetical protein LBD45_02335 [Bacteroidales bacterium]|nr:hypothetical protein [Bacteroidales bacterium]
MKRNRIKKKRINSKRLIFAFICMAFSGCLLQAQVLIGSTQPPKDFSVLEISTDDATGGLRLPQLSTAQRATLNLGVSPQLAKGLVIYNVEKDSVQFWNNAKWVNLNSSSGAQPVILFSPPTLNVTASAGAGNSTAQNASCTTGGNYMYTIVSGGSYCSLQAALSPSGQFQLNFSTNNSGKKRAVLVQVTDPCGGSAYFAATQLP